MKSHQVIKESCKKRGIKSIASEIGVSSSLMYKWSQPYDGSGSGSKNPLDRIVELINAIQDPIVIEWICEQSGGYFVRNPESRQEENYEVMPATNEIVAQFSALLGEISQAAQDNTIEKKGRIQLTITNRIKKHRNILAFITGIKYKNNMKQIQK